MYKITLEVPDGAELDVLVETIKNSDLSGRVIDTLVVEVSV